MGHEPTERRTPRPHARAGAAAVAGMATAVALASPAQAQENWEHIHGTVEQGGSYTAVAATATDEVWAFGSDPEDSEAPRIERWDGQQWQEETAPDGLTSPPVAAEAGPDGQVWALAYSYDAGTSAAHYDGESWTASAIDFAPEMEPTALAAVGDGNAWALAASALGETEAVYFDGQEWTSQPAPTADEGLGVAETGEVFAVGGQGEELIVERWDGADWVPEEIPQVDNPSGEAAASFNDVLVRSADDVWAAGNISWKDADEKNHYRPVLARYDGTEWTVQVGEEEGTYDAVADDGEGGLYLSNGDWNPAMEHRTADGRVTRQEIVADGHEIRLGGLDSLPDGAGAVLAVTALDQGDPEVSTSHARVYGTGAWY
ncbi:hypothetical protein GCM10007147_42930 [Nocardiopsis kunsanensis]|uniref:Uncharacterized protein n=1 Tax=Nocardiopsis kunsanensis TaxID=141693 RepID=A0A919CMH7_9ACTN|nr:hypothetical protein [Nocardiopsis kunsanensis]GHD36016.1 hypothetical protein GCM10007147_42930 [Nocardiopsis kunsanensis]